MDALGLDLTFIDMGGGYFGGVPGKPSAPDYIEAVCDVLGSSIDRKKTRLIVEPGSAIIGSAVDLWTSVLDAKQTAWARVITTDGSRVNIDPLWKKSSYRYRLETEAADTAQKQIICGYTCMDHDRLMVLKGAPSLSRGDKIIYERVGAYTMTFGGPFIRYFPDVYFLRDSEKVVRGGVLPASIQIEKVRSRMSVEDYVKINGLS